jgi:hypothetical protein
MLGMTKEKMMKSEDYKDLDKNAAYLLKPQTILQRMELLIQIMNILLL